MEASKRRLDWVDVAKGIGIISVIIGHTVKIGSFVRDIIFSFHMPLFFVLSGFTSRRISSWKSFFIKLRRDSKTLLLPILLVKIVLLLFNYSRLDNLGLESFFSTAKTILKQFIYCSGVPVHDMPALGVCWFLVSLFTAKTIINFLHVVFKSDRTEIIPLLLGSLGILLGLKEYRLPLNLDVTLTAIFFITIGTLAKNYVPLIKKYLPLILMASILFYLFGIISNHILDMSARDFGVLNSSVEGCIITILTALSGTFMVCILSKTLCDKVHMRSLLSFLGSNSIIIFLAHAMDFCTRMIWSVDSVLISCVLRLSFCLAFSVAFIWLRNEFKRTKQLE